MNLQITAVATVAYIAIGIMFLAEHVQGSQFEYALLLGTVFLVVGILRAWMLLMVVRRRRRTQAAET